MLEQHITGKKNAQKESSVKQVWFNKYEKCSIMLERVVAAVVVIPGNSY